MRNRSQNFIHLILSSMENLKNLLNTIWDAIWQNKIIRVQIWNVISAGITLVVAYLTNLQDKVSNEILVQILVL
jgi:uncharacterized BrkB/YihY/UPF0761 family membrane protein